MVSAMPPMNNDDSNDSYLSRTPQELNDADILWIMKEAIVLLAWEVRAYRLVEQESAAAAMAMAGQSLKTVQDSLTNR